MRMQKVAAVAIAIGLGASAAQAEGQAAAQPEVRALVHAELDPLTFANQPGYGGQIGIRPRALRGVRLAIASFALHVPDALTGLLVADGVDQRVRPSGAVYGLYYLAPPGRDGLAIGASLRYLRLRYERDNDARVDDVRELSPELIVGYQWHPLHGRFYAQPWGALGVTVWRDHAPFVDEPAVSPFVTVNLGYEYAL